MWLGRAWFSDPVKNYDPDHPRPIQGAISQATKPLANATLLALSEAIGLQGANANEATSGGNYTTPVRCPLPIRQPLFYFENSVVSGNSSREGEERR